MLPSNSEAKYGYMLQTIISSEVVYVNLTESMFFAILKARLVLSDSPLQWNSLHNLLFGSLLSFLTFKKS